MVLATDLLRSLRMSEVETPSRGTFVLTFKVGISLRSTRRREKRKDERKRRDGGVDRKSLPEYSVPDSVLLESPGAEQNLPRLESLGPAR
jgi:hypothetical protein